MIQIRTFQLSDKEELARLYLKTRQETFFWMPSDYFKLADFETDTEKETILVAVDGPKIVGFISIWMPDNFIHNLFIQEDYQSHGIGKKLLDAGIKLLQKPVRLKCVLRNIKACSFYEKHGWIPEKTGSSDLGDYQTYRL